MANYSEVEDRTIKKLWTRLIPFIFILYIVSFLDRVNLGYAALTMNKALNISSTAFGLISGIFFFGYFIFESNPGPKSEISKRISLDSSSAFMVILPPSGRYSRLLHTTLSRTRSNFPRSIL
ncbi:Major facilitator superfamily transporter [Acididesulfobacillus acetoxydans]|uniref:Major facilitator superfamily domain, general substrate transporter n=1 Tax=Acididesulfobacillus acetoxydans TaxID=1561005 RepID=A0A8S0XC36_9FIRM|nr:hypothetical protein [Acididesulfobacillus acetoxydans]CAA7601956.1 Major facilitator superfamily transporter [Acididesulfobacillus acetoxydans]CEJ08200.1 Major facilitator superfamily domain, general substrate transporter [Acididesulfobacillus acetoxydans]